MGTSVDPQGFLLVGFQVAPSVAQFLGPHTQRHWPNPVERARHGVTCLGPGSHSLGWGSPLFSTPAVG